MVKHVGIAGRAVIMLVVVSTLVLGLAPATFGRDTVVEFMHYQWLEPGKKDILNGLADTFEKEFQGVKIKRTPVPFGQYRDVVFTRIAGGTAPDIIVGLHDTLPKLISSGYLEPLDKYIDFSKIKDRLVDSSSIAIGPDGRYYGVVQENIPHEMFYNKRLFKEAGVKVPTTIEEFFEAGKKLTKPGEQYAYFIVTNPAETSRMFFDVSKWVYGFGGRWARNGVLTLNEPNVIKAIEMYKKVYDSKMVPWGVDKSTARKLFFQGKVAMAFEGSYFYEWVRAENPELATDLGASRVPFPTGTTAGEILFLAIPKNAPHKETAAEFLKFLLRPEIQRRYVEETKVASALQGVASEDFIKRFPWYSAFDGAPMIPAVAEGLEEFTPEIQQIVTNKVAEVLHVNKPAHVAMDEAQKEAEAMIRRKK